MKLGFLDNVEESDLAVTQYYSAKKQKDEEG